LEDEAVRVVVGMRLGLDLHCVSHRFRHAMVCKKTPGKIARHQMLNDVIWQALNTFGVPAIKESSGLNR